MNVNNLEKLVRQALKGESAQDKSDMMVKSGLISPVEHRSLQSLSFHIAANIHHEKGSNSVAMVRPQALWI